MASQYLNFKCELCHRLELGIRFSNKFVSLVGSYNLSYPLSVQKLPGESLQCGTSGRIFKKF